MEIPSKISPCPIIESVMEVRFESNVDEGAVFGMIFNQIKEEFSTTINLPILEFPANIRKENPQLKHLPHYRVISKNDPNELIQIGPKVFSVIISNDYPGWDKFLSRIKFGLEKLQNSGVIQKVTRFSLRYTNFFSENILLKSNLNLLLSGAQLNSLNSVLMIEIPDADFLNKLSIATNAFKQTDEGPLKGSTIDIDCINEREIPNFFEEQDRLLNDCHISEKKVIL